jgi:hypothetical protein
VGVAVVVVVVVGVGVAVVVGDGVTVVVDDGVAAVGVVVVVELDEQAAGTNSVKNAIRITNHGLRCKLVFILYFRNRRSLSIIVAR